MSEAIKAVCVKAHFRKYNYKALKQSFTTNVQMGDKLKETPVAPLCCEHFAHVIFPSDRNQYQVIQTDHFNPMMKHFHPDDNGLLQCPHPQGKRMQMM